MSRPNLLLPAWCLTGVLLALAALPAASTAAQKPAAGEDPLSWPSVRPESRPWTRWWWLGSAVDEREITRHLELFQAAGLGGVEVSPIYGVKGSESRFQGYLSPRWHTLLGHTTKEAARLGLGVDMIQGTGWPFGGPWVEPADTAQRVVLTAIPIDAKGQLTGRLQPDAPLQALMAYSSSGQVMDLTGRVDSVGRLDWKAPEGNWTLYGVQMRPTAQAVKRAAPGGEGAVLDHFSREAGNRYFNRFDPLLRGQPDTPRLRGVFNDSFEVYGANWTDDLLAQFQRRRGYDLRLNLPALMGKDTPERVARIRTDYRQTVSEILLEEFTRPWSEWARGNRTLTRLQAHGSPGNVLDLYGATDIPETEMFGPGRREGGVRPPDQPVPPVAFADTLVCKLASSAAHVTGKSLCSSESMTWLSEHFRGSLADMKGQVDSLLVSGVNHVFYHGTPFSPADAEWPGWLFYASTEVTPTNSWWRDLPALNTYITRSQSFLQRGKPDNDLLVYFPVHELWAKDDGSKDLLQYLTVHNADNWLDKNLPEFAGATRRLWERGHTFDLVSDAQLRDRVTFSGGKLGASGAAYRTLLVAGSPSMPHDTFSRILTLAREGATVVVVGSLPADVPGWADLEDRRGLLKAELTKVKQERRGEGLFQASVGRGRLWIGKDVEALLRAASVPRETAVDLGLQLIRRVDDEGHAYFLANRGEKPVDGWVPLGVDDRNAALFDPMSGRSGFAETRRKGERTEVYLQLSPGQSVLVRTFARTPGRGERWRYLEPTGPPVALAGQWDVDFVDGGPSMPQPARLSQLSSWTTWTGDRMALHAFSGTGRYRLSFPRPTGQARGWALELGQVYHSARIRLNGTDLGTLIAPPYRVELPDQLLRSSNDLEIEVTNLMANRIADMDRRRVPWQKYYFVNIQYQPFNASAWEPMPSGLVGPVRLQPLRRKRVD